MSTEVIPVDESGQEVPQQALAVRQPEKLTVRSLMSGAKLEELQKVCARGADAQKMLKMFAIAGSRTPKLLQCTPLSMLDAMVRCAELGLMPSTLGTAYLIPYENRKNNTVECQLIIGYRGLVELARRSGQIARIEAHIVYKQDEFTVEFGLIREDESVTLLGLFDRAISHAVEVATGEARVFSPQTPAVHISVGPVHIEIKLNATGELRLGSDTGVNYAGQSVARNTDAVNAAAALTTKLNGKAR